jgi:hypothetical protein
MRQLIILFLAVSGVWLALLGEWRTIVMGLLFAGPSVLFLALLFAPGLIFNVLATINDGGRLRPSLWDMILILGGLLYNAVVLTVWVLGVFGTLLRIAEDNTLPTMLWASAVAIVPVLWLAEKDADGSGSQLTASFAMTGAIALMITLLVSESIKVGAINFFVVMLIGVLISFKSAITEWPS